MSIYAASTGTGKTGEFVPIGPASCTLPRGIPYSASLVGKLDLSDVDGASVLVASLGIGSTKVGTGKWVVGQAGANY